MLNDLLFPIKSDFNHEAFETSDDNVFSNGSVDVFFEKSFDIKRNIVIMDGQGTVSNIVIESIAILTNLALINVHTRDLENESTI